MTQHAESLARKIGRIDALIFFIAWSCICSLYANHYIDALPFIFFIILPASAFVGWRGASSARKILRNSISIVQATIDGFCSGASLVCAIWLWSTINSALASGGVLDGLTPFQLSFWHAIAVTLLPLMGIGGLMGSFHGIVFFYVNTWLVARANPSINRDG